MCDYNRINGILRRFTKLRDGIASAGYATPYPANNGNQPKADVPSIFAAVEMIAASRPFEKN